MNDMNRYNEVDNESEKEQSTIVLNNDINKKDDVMEENIKND